MLVAPNSLLNGPKMKDLIMGSLKYMVIIEIEKIKKSVRNIMNLLLLTTEECNMSVMAELNASNMRPIDAEARTKLNM